MSYAGLTDIDDALPVTPTYATYDGQTYKTASGQSSVGWVASSNNPGLGFNLDDTAETAAGRPERASSRSATPAAGASAARRSGRRRPAKWSRRTGSTRPRRSSPTTRSTPTTRTRSPPKPGGPDRLSWAPGTCRGSPTAPRGCSCFRPTRCTAPPSRPRSTSASTPRLRTRSARHQLAVEPRGVGSLFRGGGLAENFDTGELAAVWPTFSTHADTMRLYLSSDGGAKFSGAQNVATVQSGYADFDNARVAISAMAAASSPSRTSRT